jgi:hypothetical protein
MSKRSKKAFLPKKIAGVKVPKNVRKGRFGEMLASPTGQKLIAQAIMAAGAIAAGKKAADSSKVREAANDVKQKVADKGGDAVQQTGDAGGALAYALTEAARTFADALKRGGAPETRSFAQASEGLGPAEVPAFDTAGPEADDAKKQSSAYEAGPL